MIVLDSRLDFATLSDEELYFLKFTNLIMRLGPRAVRVLFDKKIPPDQLCSRLNQYKHKLQKLKSQKVIYKFHWNTVMFPATGNVTVYASYQSFSMI